MESEVIIVDHFFQGQKNSIASFLIPFEDGLILIESGPYSTFPNLVKGIQAAGYEASNVKFVLLTHIHLDHAGAAWAFAKLGAHVYVHTLGYKHLQDPTRLIQSARMIYQDQMDKLWGEMHEIDPKFIHAVEDGDNVNIGHIKARVIYTPGHAKHHIAWKIGEMIFTGDVAGARINLGPVAPPCPPPDIDIELWMNSIDRLLEEKDTKTYFLTHFGRVEDIEAHMSELKECLSKFVNFLLPYYEEQIEVSKATNDFVKFVEQRYQDEHLSNEDIESYKAANPANMSVGGIMRYLGKKSRS